MPTISAPKTAADAHRLISHVQAGRVPKEHAAAIRTELAKTKPDAFGDPGLKSKLDGLLKRIEEGAISVPMMAFGWTRELFEGNASIIRGRGTIRGPIPAELKAINKTGVSSAGVVSI